MNVSKPLRVLPSSTQMQRLGCCVALSAVGSQGCYGHLQGPVPVAPTVEAPRQQRVSYYNRYRPIQHVHIDIGRPMVYGPMPTPLLGASLLANGMEIHSLRDIAPALNPNAEFSQCMQREESASTTATILLTASSVLFVGGVGLGTYGLINVRSPVLGGIGVGSGLVGIILLTIGVLGPMRTADDATRRGLVLYDPLLRERLGIAPEQGPGTRPTGGTEPCR